jgi:hypothetical protein
MSIASSRANRAARARTSGRAEGRRFFASWDKLAETLRIQESPSGTQEKQLAATGLKRICIRRGASLADAVAELKAAIST